MKLIKISTDLELSVHEFPQGSYAEQNKFLCGLIGNGCSTYEHVMARRLYTDFKVCDHPTKIQGECVSMLVDEEGMLKLNTVNMVGSYLYMTDVHGNPIMGNILLVGEAWGDDGIDFCGIEDGELERLEAELNTLVLRAKKEGCLL